MYWWDIQALKKELIAGSFPDAKIFPYFLAFSLCAALVLIPFPGEYTRTDVYAGFIEAIVSVMMGTFYIYGANGGAGGSHFLERYYTLAWVVGVRFAVMALIPALFFIIVGLSFLEGYSETETTAWWDIILIAVLSILYFLRLGKHMKDVASGASVSEGSATEKVVTPSN